MIGFRTVIPASVSNRSSRSNATTSPAYVNEDAAAAGALVPRNIGSTTGLRTLDDVRDQISQEIAINTITKAEYIDGKNGFNILIKLLKTTYTPFTKKTFSLLKRRKNWGTFRHVERQRKRTISTTNRCKNQTSFNTSRISVRSSNYIPIS